MRNYNSYVTNLYAFISDDILALEGTGNMVPQHPLLQPRFHMWAFSEDLIREAVLPVEGILGYCTPEYHFEIDEPESADRGGQLIMAKVVNSATLELRPFIIHRGLSYKALPILKVIIQECEEWIKKNDLNTPDHNHNVKNVFTWSRDLKPFARK